MSIAQIADVLLCGQTGSGLQFLATLLENEGFHTRLASRISEIVTPCLRREFRVALLVINGTSNQGVERQLETLRILHQLDPGLPVVVVGDDESLEFERRVRSYGVFYFITRPISNLEVRKVLECAIAKSRSERTPNRPTGHSK